MRSTKKDIYFFYIYFFETGEAYNAEEGNEVTIRDWFIIRWIGEVVLDHTHQSSRVYIQNNSFFIQNIYIQYLCIAPLSLFLHIFISRGDYVLPYPTLPYPHLNLIILILVPSARYKIFEQREGRPPLILDKTIFDMRWIVLSNNQLSIYERERSYSTYQIYDLRFILRALASLAIIWRSHHWCGYGKLASLFF